MRPKTMLAGCLGAFVLTSRLIAQENSEEPMQKAKTFEGKITRAIIWITSPFCPKATRRTAEKNGR